MHDISPNVAAFLVLVSMASGFCLGAVIYPEFWGKEKKNIVEVPKGCSHLVIEGSGAMCDGLVCVTCGLDKYPEASPELANAPRINVKDPHMFHKEYPFVRIYMNGTGGEYTHFYNRNGEIEKRKY